MTRADFGLIADLIPKGARVLDLGCGDGELLSGLQQKGCTGTGVEIEAGPVLQAIARGVNVIELDIDLALDEFGDDSYDVVVLSRTLQAVHRPAEVLRQIRRIARCSIVSMPNFALWRNRLRLLAGRMPISKDLPFEWFDTPNLHYTSLKDLEPLFTDVGFRITRRIALDQNGQRHWARRSANLLASSALYFLERS